MRDNTLMTFAEHLDELRKRFLYSIYAILITTTVVYLFKETLFIYLVRPLIVAWQERGLGTPKIHFANPIEPFFVYLKITFVGAIFLSSPIIFYQLWKFIAPGLYKNEKRYVIPFSLASGFFFVGGILFGYFVVFPYAFEFFLEFARQDIGAMESLLGGIVTISTKQTFDLTPTIMMDEYFSLVWRLLLAFGLVFELPVLISFLALVGLVNSKSLWRFNRYFTVIAFVVGAILTPPDVITQTLMSLPLIVLYNASILLAWIFERRREKKKATPT